MFFSPEDLNIIENGPGERRRFLDSELCQLDGVYITELAGYNHIVNQRNRLLKDCYMNPGTERYAGCLGYADGQITERRSSGSGKPLWRSLTRSQGGFIKALLAGSRSWRSCTSQCDGGGV